MAGQLAVPLADLADDQDSADVFGAPSAGSIAMVGYGFIAADKPKPGVAEQQDNRDIAKVAGFSHPRGLTMA